MIEIKNAYKSFGEQVIFEDISIQIKDPGMYALVGSSGCGKSTLLNIIAGYDTFNQGSIKIDEKVITIFQNYELIDELNVFDNIFLGRKAYKSDQELLEELGLIPYLTQFPNELSGGQKQRVGIARALIGRPKIICCDEPTESLDVINKEIVMQILKEYAKDHIVIIVTHQMDTVEKFADTIISIEDHKLHMVHPYTNCIPVDTSKERKIPKDQIPLLIENIIRKRNCLFLVLFMVLMLAAQVTTILRQTFFNIPETTNTVNADMLYLNVPSEIEQENLGLKEEDKIIQFNNKISLGNQAYVINVYPYVENDECCKVDGAITNGVDIIINQNLKSDLFNNDIKDKELILEMPAYTKVYTFPMKITGTVEEPDTKAYNIYYDKNAFLDYAKTVELESGGNLAGLIRSRSLLFEKKVGYDHVSDWFEEYKEKPQITLKSPLYEERQQKLETSKLSRYLFTAMTWVILILLTAFIFVLTKKETNSYIKSFAILASQDVPLKTSISTYLRAKSIPILIFVAVDIGALIYVKNKLPYLNIKLLICIVVVEVIFYFISMKLALKDLKEENISAVLKNWN